MNALVPIGQPAFTVSDVEKVASAIARGGLFGSKDPYAVLTLCLLAQAEGQHPAVVFRDYHIISGKPAKKAEAMLRDFLSAGGKIEWHALTDEIADATFSHPSGGTARISWDHKRAVQAQLAGNAMYKKYPRQMLRSRTISEGVRTIYPGATSGLYVPEEVSSFDAISPPTPAEEAPNGGSTDSAPTPQGNSDQPAKVPGIHKIKTSIREMKALGNEAATIEEFEAILPNYAEQMKALEDASHSWWTGDDDNGGFESIPAWIARRRAELDTDSAVNVAIDSMNRCETKMALESWMENNAAAIEALDGADSRRFQAAYDAQDAEIAAMDMSSA